MSCKICNESVLQIKDCCDVCKASQQRDRLCRKCREDRACARCGNEIAYVRGNMTSMALCKLCETELRKT